MKNATKPNLPPYGGAYSAGEDFTKKRTEVMIKFEFLRQNFRSREKKIRTNLEKARKIWKKVSKRFKWWGSLP